MSLPPPPPPLELRTPPVNSETNIGDSIMNVPNMSSELPIFPSPKKSHPLWWVQYLNNDFEKEVEQLRLKFISSHGFPEWNGKLFYDLDEAVEYAKTKENATINYRYALHPESGK
jgi:hypothetical protein